MGLDFLFIVLYSLFLITLVSKLASYVDSNEFIQKLGRFLFYGVFLAAILDIVENVDSTDEAEVGMRKLGLHELMRTSRISEVDSNILRYYCMDEDGVFDRQIQFEAMKELAERTRQHTI